MKNSNGYVKRYNVESPKRDVPRTVNYNYPDQDQPHRRMGNDDFANMPTEPVVRYFSNSHDVRSGVINRFECGIEKESGIQENQGY